MKEKDNHKWK